MVMDYFSLALLATFLVYVPKASDCKEIWKVSSVPNTNDFDDLLAPFHSTHRTWGEDSLSYSNTHKGALEVHYRKGSYTKTSHRGGGFYSTPSSLGKAVDDLVLTYDVFFHNFGWAKGGKLPGLFGGEDGDGAYKCSGGNNPSSCFSLRLMWRDGGKGELYAYISDHQASGFKDRDDVIAHSHYGQSIGRGKIHFKNDEWLTVLQQVHLNSGPHTPDGWVKICLLSRDGSRQCFTADHLVIRKNSSHHMRGVFFSTFFGGSSSDYAAPNDCYAYFKNFVLREATDDIENIFG